jgi:hypothetical protein
MKKNRIITLSVFVVCIIAAVFIFTQNSAQDRTQNETIPRDQINKSIQTLASVVNDQNFQTFGLTSKDQLKSLKAGKQYNKYMIGLNDIKNYKSGEDVETIIKELPSVEVPLVDETGKIQTSIEFVKNNGKWETSGFGLSSDLVSVRNMQSARSAASITNGRLIRIPALRVSFIALTASTGLTFIALQNNESLGFKQGEAILASNAILKLVPVAKQYNGLPD